MKLRFKFVFIFLIFFVSACSAPKQESKKRFFWPPLSAEPKIEYIEFFQTDYDVKKRNVGFLEEAIFGRDIPKLMFSQPFDVYADGHGRFFVTETRAGYVQVVDINKGSFSKLKDREGRDYFFKQPLGITGDSRGNIFVADSKAKKVLIFGADYHLVDEWSGRHFSRPINLEVDELRSRVYVVDPGRHVVTILDYESGGVIGKIGGRGTEDEQFNYPLDVDLDQEGNLYVLDSMNARVKKFSPDGAFLLSFGERGTASGSFQMAKGLAVSPSGHIYVTDSMANRIVVFDSIGRYLMTFGGKYPAEEGIIAPGGLYLPQGIDVDGNGGIWIVDTLNRMVHRFQYLNKRFIKENPILPGQMVNPFEVN